MGNAVVSGFFFVVWLVGMVVCVRAVCFAIAPSFSLRSLTRGASSTGEGGESNNAYYTR